MYLLVAVRQRSSRRGKIGSNARRVSLGLPLLLVVAWDYTVLCIHVLLSRSNIIQQRNTPVTYVPATLHGPRARRRLRGGGYAPHALNNPPTRNGWARATRFVSTKLSTKLTRKTKYTHTHACTRTHFTYLHTSVRMEDVREAGSAGVDAETAHAEPAREGGAQPTRGGVEPRERAPLRRSQGRGGEGREGGQ